MVGLDQVAHRPAGEFSKGMARRLGLAQALVNDPELLILDEPTSGLDPLGTRQVKDLILELGRRGKTILLTSHLLADVEDVCDRMVILYGGRIRAEGTSEQLLADSQHTLLRTPRLTDAAVAAVEQALHASQGVGIERVEAPRQSLEALFLDIVEKARAEQLATSGAQAGGKIASFLQSEAADAGETGASVVDELVRAAERPAMPAPAVSRVVPGQVAPSAPAGADRGVLDALIDPSKAEGAAKAQSAPRAAPPAVRKDAAGNQPDQGLIDSLLSDSDKPADGRGGGEKR